MLKQGFGTYSRQQSPSSIQHVVIANQADHAVQANKTHQAIDNKRVYYPLCLQRSFQVDRITNLPNHTPARINKKQDSFHPHRLCYILHKCYIIETCSDKLLQFRCYVQTCFATPYNLWILTVHRLLNIDSGTQAASTFVPYLYCEFCIQIEIPIFKGEGEETHPSGTQNQWNGRLKFVQSNAQAPSTTPVHNQASIAIFFTTSTYSQPTPRSNKRSGSHHTNEFRATSQRTELQSLLLHLRRVELSHLWSLATSWHSDRPWAVGQNSIFVLFVVS